MSSYDQAVAATLTQIALAYDGAFVGMTLAIAAIKTILKYRSSSSALARIRRAPSVSISGLRSLVPSSPDENSSAIDENLVIVRGQVQPKSAVDGKWMGFRDKVLVSEETGERAVIVQRTQTCLYNEWRGLIWLTYDLRTLFGRHRKKHQSTSLRMVGLLDEQKILPVGQEVTAVGICRSQDGVLEIKSSKEIPYFLSEMTKDQMEVELAVNIKTLLWSGVVLGMLSFGILGYSLLRNWARWKQWRHRRQHVQEQQSVLPENSGEDEAGDVPDGELCVICLMTRRRSAFVPCGHLVCCPRCALSVERDLHPKCPVCRQAIRTSLRIYAS
ncbi:E3 ubiquitin-protein ligase SPL2 isoform X3 [Aristolochia californica]|uniref:E3 ubiquitin-protein ligase SPL2 isoform X3 n=1 Tax=Aristolochia californica TaxID=171875 RepID=UPI0035DA1D3B